MFDFKKILEQAKQIGEKSQKMKEELEKIEIEGKAGGDFVIVKGTAGGKVTQVTVSDELFSLNDKSMLEGMVKGAFIDFLNQQKEKITELSKQQLNDIELPPMFDSFLDSFKN